MKVTFQTTADDFVDIAMRIRTRKVDLNYFLNLALTAIGAGALCGGPIYYIARVWQPTVIAFVAAAAGILIYNYGWRERYIRDVYTKKKYLPAFVTVEITDEGISFDQRTGKHRELFFRPWDAIESIQETPDAIYFKRKNGMHSAVRKRGFESDEQAKEFLDQAHQYLDSSK